MERKKGRLGRPLKPASERKPDTISFRVREGFRDQLAHAAKAKDRPINAEIEARLQESLDDDAMGKDLEALHALIRHFLRLVGTRKTDRWNFDLRDAGAADALCLGLNLLVTALCTGPLSEERVKQFWIETAKVRRERGAAIAQIPVEAFHVVVAAKRADEPNPLELAEWLHAADAEKGREP